jgi:hypothetical protein
MSRQRSAQTSPQRRVSYTRVGAHATAEFLGLPLLVFLLGEEASGPAELFLDVELGLRQKAFRARLADSGVTTATITRPDQLEAALLQALTTLPHPVATGADGTRPVWSIPAHGRPSVGRGGPSAEHIGVEHNGGAGPARVT